jgi:hypothetical protein
MANEEGVKDEPELLKGSMHGNYIWGLIPSLQFCGLILGFSLLGHVCFGLALFVVKHLVALYEHLLCILLQG